VLPLPLICSLIAVLIVAAVALALVAVQREFRSISALIERAPVMGQLDSVGNDVTNY
jgi:Tfp pilus assembly protein PilV